MILYVNFHSKMYRIVLLAVIYTLVSKAQIVTFCGTLMEEESFGAKGWFQMKFLPGVAQYTFDVDLSLFDFSAAGIPDGSCDLSQGLKWHLTTDWPVGNTISGASEKCNNLGGTYDPNLACSSVSNYATTLCPAIGRTKDDEYDYLCDAKRYSSGSPEFCEIGDFSGKFGNAQSSHSAPLKYVHKTKFQDTMPAYVTTYLQENSVSPKWSSILFSCSNDISLVCMKFIHSDSSVCHDEEELTNSLSSMDYALIAISTMVLVYGLYYWGSDQHNIRKSDDRKPLLSEKHGH